MKLRHTTLALALACSGIGAAHAEDLMDAYRQARDSDPVLQQAEASRRDVSENVAQARAVLLPQISANGNFSDEHGTSSSYVGCVHDNNFCRFNYLQQSAVASTRARRWTRPCSTSASSLR